MSTRPLSDRDYRSLAEFRHALRVFLHFSEDAVRREGLTPAQHQLLLAVKGWGGATEPSPSDLAERLQLKLHSVVELVARAEDSGLVRRRHDPADARRQRVTLTAAGERKLAHLSVLHRTELRRVRGELLEALERL